MGFFLDCEGEPGYLLEYSWRVGKGPLGLFCPPASRRAVQIPQLPLANLRPKLTSLGLSFPGKQKGSLSWGGWKRDQAQTWTWRDEG